MSAAVDLFDVPALAADWTPLGETPIRKIPNYDLTWCSELELNQHIVAIASAGGPIAITLDVRLSPPDSSGRLKVQPSVQIRTASGTQLGTAQWTSASYIVGMGWDTQERLICVAENGQVFIYSIHGEFVAQNNILHDRNQMERVVECKFWHTSYGTSGFAWRTAQDKFSACLNPEREIRIRAFGNLDEPSTCWCPLPYISDRQALVAILVGAGGHIHRLDTPSSRVETLNSQLKSEPIIWKHMVVNVAGTMVAMVDDKGYIWMGSSNFKTCHCEHEEESASVLGMAWLDDRAVVLLRKDHLFIKGAKDHWHKIRHSGSCALQQEVDGVRLLFQDSYDFLQILPSDCQAVGSMGSLDPGAVLLDAFTEFIHGDGGKAHEYIRFIDDKGHLLQAVNQCIGAATEMVHPLQQKQLLKAAHFGRSFMRNGIPPSTVDKAVTANQWLRILNQVRCPEVGIPLTMAELKTIGLKTLMERLTNRELYPLAIALCSFLKYSPDEGEIPVLMHWAKKRIAGSKSHHDQVAGAIIAKMQEHRVKAPYAALARLAKQHKQTELAKILLSQETAANTIIPFLLELGEFDKALDQAIASGDPDLIITVLLDLRRKRAADIPYKLVTRPEADALYKKYLADSAVAEIVRSVQGGGTRGVASNVEALHHFDDYFRASYQPSLSHDQRSKLVLKAKVAHSTDDSPAKYHEQAIRERGDLLNFQDKEGKSKELPLYGLSVFDTLVQLLKAEQYNLVDKVARDFKVSDKLIWHSKVKAFSACGKWMELERFCKSKRPPPIGYQPFVEACVANGNLVEAERYVEKAPLDGKWKLYMRINNPMKAADWAFQAKDPSALTRILDQHTDNVEVKNAVESYLDRLPR